MCVELKKIINANPNKLNNETYHSLTVIMTEMSDVPLILNALSNVDHHFLNPRQKILHPNVHVVVNHHSQ